MNYRGPGPGPLARWSQAGGSLPLASWRSTAKPGLQGPSRRRQNCCSECGLQGRQARRRFAAGSSPPGPCQPGPLTSAHGSPLCRVEHLPERVRTALLEQQLQGGLMWASPAEQEGDTVSRSGSRASCIDVDATLLAELRRFNQGAPGRERCALTLLCSRCHARLGLAVSLLAAGRCCLHAVVWEAGALGIPELPEAVPKHKHTHTTACACPAPHLSAGATCTLQPCCLPGRCRSDLASLPGVPAGAAEAAAAEEGPRAGEQLLLVFSPQGSPRSSQDTSKAVAGSGQRAASSTAVGRVLAAARLAAGLLCCAVLLVRCSRADMLGTS